MLSSAVFESAACSSIGLPNFRMRTFKKLAAVDLARCDFQGDYVSLLRVSAVQSDRGAAIDVRLPH